MKNNFNIKDILEYKISKENKSKEKKKNSKK